MKSKIIALCLLITPLLTGHLLAYAETGHRIVGSIADQLIAGKPTEEAVKKLLGTVTLERAATLPDELRGEDRQPGSFKLPENPQLEAELLAFRAANPPNDEDLKHLPPSHHWFHYTDVPIQENKYASTKVGTSKWDVVHMIVYCTRVLEGVEKPDNEMKITPAVAVVLLAHFVGDIHQPLHVGAAYLSKQGELQDPNVNPSALEDRGGNDINFGASSLHGYWDYDCVESALSYRRRLLGKRVDEFTTHDYAAEIVGSEPANWKLDPSLKPEQWPEKWADEILPVAREAHSRLKFLPQEVFDTDRKGKPSLRWTAIEAPHPGKDTYAVFASKTAGIELPKAGWRLAALLEAVLPGTPTP